MFILHMYDLCQAKHDESQVLKHAIVQDDDNMFWDPVLPAAPPKAALLQKPAAERKTNGAASARPPPSPEKVGFDLFLNAA